jgi:hypothetical protein
MIKEAREITPFIDFGFNRQSITVRPNIPITIWQSNIFQIGTLFEVVSTDFVATEITRNKIVGYFTSAGVRDFKVTISGTSKESNTLSIDVQGITCASEDIFFNNENITFNSL